MTARTCSTCKHFKLSSQERAEFGRCRAHPPVIDFTEPEIFDTNDAGDVAATRARFPIVDIDCTCGEWRGPNSAEESLGALISIIGDATGQQCDPGDALQIARELVARGVVSL